MSSLNPLESVKRIKSLAEAGIVFTNNPYDEERFEELREISLHLLSEISGATFNTLNQFYLPAKDYPTPKIDIRGMVLNEKNEVLMVKEKEDNCWSLPGGWGDIGYTPTEVIIKEIKEETGLEVKVDRLLAVYDKRCHPHPPQPFYVYKMVFYCVAEGGVMDPAFDISSVKYFPVNKLPMLSEDRILKTQIEQLHEMILENIQNVYVD